MTEAAMKCPILRNHEMGGSSTKTNTPYESNDLYTARKHTNQRLQGGNLP